MRKIPFLKPKLLEHEKYIHFLKSIDESRLYSNFGPLNTLFERRVIDEYFDGQGAATTVSNGTTGLVLALSLLKRPGARYAVMPSFTFAAAPLAAIWCDLEPYFVDIRRDDWCVNEEKMDETLEYLGDQVALVMPYATFGTNLDLTAYQSWHERGVPVVVDAAASFGATATGGHFGKNFPGAVVFSFHATKAFGIGEGGLVYSRDPDLISRIRQAANFGFSETRASVLTGLNGKLSEYGAAIALATLDVFATKMDRRTELYKSYMEQLDQRGMFNDGWRVQQLCGQVPFQFVPLLCPEGEDNTDIVARLAARGIESRTYFSPACHEQQLFVSAPGTTLSVTECIARRALSLPFWEDMTPDTIACVVEGLG